MIRALVRSQCQCSAYGPFPNGQSSLFSVVYSVAAGLSASMKRRIGRDLHTDKVVLMADGTKIPGPSVRMGLIEQLEDSCRILHPRAAMVGRNRIERLDGQGVPVGWDPAGEGVAGNTEKFGGCCRHGGEWVTPGQWSVPMPCT